MSPCLSRYGSLVASGRLCEYYRGFTSRTGWPGRARAAACEESKIRLSLTTMNASARIETIAVVKWPLCASLLCL